MYVEGHLNIVRLASIAKLIDKYYFKTRFMLSPVAQSCPTLQPHKLQHTRPPCPSPTPGVHPNTCPLSQWCHPTISSSVIPLSSCPHLRLSQHQGLFQWVSSSHQVAKGLEFQLQHQSPRTDVQHLGLISFRMDWLDLLAIQGTIKSLLQHHTVQKHQFFGTQFSL